MKNRLSHLIARVPVSVHSKLLVAFLVIVTLLITFGFVVLQAMSGINRRVEDMITLHHKTAAFRQLQHDTTIQLYSVSTALINPNERKLDSTLRQLHQFRYDLERVQFVTHDEVKLFEKISNEHEKLIEVVTRVVEQIRAGSSLDSVERTLDRAVMLADRLERLTNEMVNRAEADMIGKIDESIQAYLASRWVVIGFALGSVVLALLLGYSISSSLLRPLRLIDRRLSQTASGDFTQRIHVPNRDEIGTLADNLNIMNEELARLYQQLETANRQTEEKNLQLEETLQKVELYSQMLRNELERGRRMQKSFLPGELLKIDNWELMPYFKPARQVAGDFYDIFKLPGGCIGLVVADVCDKGVGAALFMALFRSLIRVFSGKTMLEGFVLPSQEISAEMLDTTDKMLEMTNFEHLKMLNAIKLTNNYIALNHGDLSMFATVFFGVLNPENGLLSYVNGGHEPVVITSPQGGIKEYLSPTGPAVGVMPDVEFLIKQTILGPGETMFAYTDGVTEALSDDGKEFSRERLLALLDEPFSSTEELLGSIAEQLNMHMGHAEQFDDITMLALRRL
ncbi:MAG: SpoIIE family protein phosphatase [Desulfobulbaceae bacterium]|nr:SpoIIE family protein phosphatase [Desulfobulbaceae bacterium]